MLLLMAMYNYGSIAQTKIRIGDLYYNLSGVSASVVSCYISRQYYIYSYTVPTKVNYNEMDFTVTEIADKAFANENSNYSPTDNSNIATSISLSSTVKKIGNNAFQNCKELEKIDLGGAETIGSYAFHSCTNLKSILIPSSVQSFGSNTFYGCNFLREIIYLPKTAPKNWTATSLTYVPDKQAYSSPNYSMNDAKVIEMITFNKTEFEYTGQSPKTGWTNNVEGYTAFLSVPTLSSEVGNHEVWIPVTFTNGNRTFTANVVYRYKINPVKLIAKVDNATREYGEDNPKFNISYYGFVNSENESVITAPKATTTATKTSDIGEYTIIVSGGEAQNYKLIYESGVLTITKAQLSAKVDDATRQYGIENPTFTISYNGLKNGETAPKWKEALRIETSATVFSDVGKYNITATGKPTNYNLSYIKNGTLTITQAPLTIKANDASRIYFDEEPNFDYSCYGFLNNDDKQVLTKVPTLITEATRTSSIGKYVITPYNAEAKNYTISYAQGELSITKRQLIATSHCSRQYGEENPVFPIEYTGFVNNESEKVLTIKPVGTTTATKNSHVGNYPITLSGGEAMNYSLVYEQGVLTVTKASLSAKVSDVTKVYGEQNPNFSIQYYGLKNDETIPVWTTTPTFHTEATKYSGVGQYAIKAVNGIAKNYDLEIGDGILTVTPAALTIRANDASRVYYEENPTLGYKCNGFVNGDNESVFTTTPTLSTSATKTSNVGAYDINVGEASSPNYSISYVNGTLTITPRTLTASVGNYERIYNEENPTFEVKYNGFVGNDNESVLKEKATANTTAKKTSDVGTYPIIVSGGSADNYQFSYISGTLAINKAEQTISWEQDLSGLIIGDQVELKAVASSGLPITYTMDSNNVAEIYVAGKDKTYLDCQAEGQFYLRAVQEGNKNYYSSTRVNKMVVIGNGSSAVRSLDDSSVKIFRMPFGIRVKDATIGEMIHVYSIDGFMQKTMKVEEQITDIPLSDRKIYIVKVGNKVVKLGI